MDAILANPARTMPRPERPMLIERRKPIATIPMTIIIPIPPRLSDDEESPRDPQILELMVNPAMPTMIITIPARKNEPKIPREIILKIGLERPLDSLYS